MEKDKSRGIKHIKDKRKYKGNSVKTAKYVPTKNKPNLGTNLDRYESDEENQHEHKLSSSTDFSLLSNVPISTGSHFQFKNEKFESEHDSEKVNLFCLDLDLLHKSITTIPFYERLGIEKAYFKEQEITLMNKEAQKHMSLYHEFIKSKNLQEAVIPDSAEVDELAEDLHEHFKTSFDDENDITKLLDDCNTCSDNTVTAKSKEKSEDNSEQDLEQWLDDILED